MSSPNINSVIIAGCLVMYLSVYLYTADYWEMEYMLPVMCMLRIWLTSIGFTLSFGAIFSKIWRVHVLFRNRKLQKKIVRDVQLMGLVLVLILLDVCLLLAWTLIHPLAKARVLISRTEIPGMNEIVNEKYTVCFNDNQTYWYAAQYVYKGLLLLFGTFLAWETRTVTIPALNDSRYIGFCVYNVVVICLFGVPVFHVLEDDQATLKFIISTVFTIFCTTLVLCIVFVPKLLIYKHPDGIKILIGHDGTIRERTINTIDYASSSRVAPEPSSARAGFSYADDSTGISPLREENVKLQKQLDQERKAVIDLRDVLHRRGLSLSLQKVGGKYEVHEHVMVNEDSQAAVTTTTFCRTPEANGQPMLLQEC